MTRSASNASAITSVAASNTAASTLSGSSKVLTSKPAHPSTRAMRRITNLLRSSTTACGTVMRTVARMGLAYYRIEILWRKQRSTVVRYVRAEHENDLVGPSPLARSHTRFDPHDIYPVGVQILGVRRRCGSRERGAQGG